MNDPSDWDRLDAAAFRVSIKRSVRRFGWYETIAGAIAAPCGLFAGLVPLAIVGIVVLGAGVWNVCRPSITGLIVDGAVMTLTGLFNCFAWAWIDGAHATRAGKWMFAGIVQILAGIGRLSIYRTARLAVNDPQAIARLEAIVEDLAKRKAASDSTVVEFRTGPLHVRRNRIGLYPDGAIALLEHQAVRLERRGDIWIEARGTTWRGRSLKVGIQMSDLQLTGRMSMPHLERFERWKLGVSQPRSIAA